MIEGKLTRAMRVLLLEPQHPDAKQTLGAFRKVSVSVSATWISDSSEAADFLLRRQRFYRVPRPDLILATFDLLSCTGYGLSVTIRSHEKLKTIPLVCLIPVDDDDAVKQTAESFADDYIQKPVTTEKFVAVVANLAHRFDSKVMIPIVSR